MVKLIVEDCEAISREKDLEVHIINHLNSETKDGEADTLRGALRDFETSSKKIETLIEEVAAAESKCQTAVQGTKTACDNALKIIKKELREQNKINKESNAIISVFEGEHIKAFTELLKSIQPKRKHNVGLRGTIVGSVANDMFTTEFITALSAVLSKDANEALNTRAKNIIEFMTYYSKARKHMKSVRELNPDALKDLSATCKWMGDNFPVMFPRRMISPKLHMLFIHVPQFARKHKNIGLFSESPFESVHAEVNGYDRTFASVTDRLQSLSCVWRAAELRRQPGFDEYKPTQRLCSTCGCAIAKDIVPHCECPSKTRKRSGKRQKIDHEPVRTEMSVLPTLSADGSSTV